MKLCTLLVLAASVFAIPLQDPAGRLHKRDDARKHIGYRALSKAEAEAIDNNGGKAVQSIGTGARQLGPGLYITRGFQEWDHKDTSLWDCVVTVDAAYWNGLKKAWVPKSFVFPENTDTCRADGLWAFRFRRERTKFLKYLDPDSTLDNTMVFAVIASHEEIIQGVVPAPIIDEGEIYLSQCAARGTDASKQLGRTGNADWELESLPGWGLGPNK